MIVVAIAIVVDPVAVVAAVVNTVVADSTAVVAVVERCSRHLRRPARLLCSTRAGRSSNLRRIAAVPVRL